MELKMLELASAFNMFPAYLYQLESAGKIPKRPKRKVTREYVQAVAAWYEKTRGDLPESAKTLLQSLQ